MHWSFASSLSPRGVQPYNFHYSRLIAPDASLFRAAVPALMEAFIGYVDQPDTAGKKGESHQQKGSAEHHFGTQLPPPIGRDKGGPPTEFGEPDTDQTSNYSYYRSYSDLQPRHLLSPFLQLLLRLVLIWNVLPKG